MFIEASGQLKVVSNYFNNMFLPLWGVRASIESHAWPWVEPVRVAGHVDGRRGSLVIRQVHAIRRSCKDQ